ncbi:MAG: N-acetylmannosamine-6-phosphate 2-epimerase [Bacillota bacterium]
MNEVVQGLKGGLIVSCQARANQPFNSPVFLAEMAKAAHLGGAIGIRANGPDNVAAIREVVDLPILGINKITYPGSDVYITPTLRSAKAVADAGSHIIAIDGTTRPRPEGWTLVELIAAIKRECQLPVMADISTYEEGEAAAAAGADLVATTLSGYTPYSPKLDGPDLELVKRLATDLTIPVIAEGRINTPEQVAQCFAVGAFAVVVGRAITMPHEITRRFAQATPLARQHG